MLIRLQAFLAAAVVAPIVTGLLAFLLETIRSGSDEWVWRDLGQPSARGAPLLGRSGG